MDYTKFLSEESKNRYPSPIRMLAPFVARKDMISLGAGLPNSETFPFDSMQLTLKTGEMITVNPAHFNQCLTYDLTSGFAPLNQWLTELQRIEHQPKVDYGLSIGLGSHDLITKALQMLIDPGTPILVENPTFYGPMNFMKSQPCRIVDVDTDEFGLIPEQLEKILHEWPNDNLPKALYTMPCASDPTGVSTSLERKQQIYTICQEYDLLILENDPYYYLQFGKDRIPSYLSLDVEGRVLRFDSLSKIMSSGMRVGFVTGPQTLIDQIDLHTMSTNLQPSGVSQLVAYEVFDKWGHDGFFDHVKQVTSFYKTKAKIFLELLDQHLTGYAEWTHCDGGMFVWLKMLGGIKDSKQVIFKKAIDSNILAIPGQYFSPTDQITPYVRLSFGNLTTDEMSIALERFAKLIQIEAGLNGVDIK